jgi:hypothetical protein
MKDIRDFHGDFAHFLQSSRTLRKHFENMLADFTNFDSDFNAPFIADWLAAIEDAEGHTTDETERDEMQYLTSEVQRTLDEFLKKLDELEYYCHKAFDDTDPDTLLLFAFDQRAKALQSIPRFIMWYLTMEDFYDDQLPHLLNAGMPLQLDTDLDTFAGEFYLAEIAQEKQKRLMKVSTRKRIAKLNKVFSFNKKVNAASQVIYRNMPIERALFKMEK